MARRMPLVASLFAVAGCASVAPNRTSQGAAADAGVRKYNFVGDITVGGGNYEHDTSGGGGLASGDTDGGFTRLRAEGLSDSGLGGGLSLEGAASDDDLFDDVGSPDVQGSFSDLFLHFTAIAKETAEFRLPFRVGPYLHRVGLEDDASGDEIDWGSFGVRGEVEPEWWFVRRDGFWFGIVGAVSAGAHATTIDVDASGLSDEFDGAGFTFGAELGVQALMGEHVVTRLSWLYRTTLEDESDSSGGVVIRDMDATFSGIALSLGFRF